MRGKVVSSVISEARREAKITKSRALDFALNSQLILTIIVAIRGQHIGLRSSNRLKQSTWRVFPRPPAASNGRPRPPAAWTESRSRGPTLAGHKKLPKPILFDGPRAPLELSDFLSKAILPRPPSFGQGGSRGRRKPFPSRKHFPGRKPSPSRKHFPGRKPFPGQKFPRP
jgi:hypothetical protein